MKQRATMQADQCEETDSLLDSNEQDAVIDSLKNEAQAQSIFFRTILMVLFSVLALGFAGVLVYTHHYPWEMSHQNVFRDLISIVAFKMLYGTMAVVCAILAIVIKDSSASFRDKRLVVAYVLAGVSSLFWIVIFVRHRVTNVILMWIPLGAPALLLVGLYVSRDLDSMLGDINSLVSAKYEYKKV